MKFINKNLCFRILIFINHHLKPQLGRFELFQYINIDEKDPDFHSPELACEIHEIEYTLMPILQFIFSCCHAEVSSLLPPLPPLFDVVFSEVMSVLSDW